MSTKWMTRSFEKSSADPRRIRFIASHEKIDRDGEVILVDGIDLTAFEHNPVLMRQHNREEVVGRVEHLRKTSIDGANALVGEAVFPDRPQSDEALKDIRAGLLNAVSIGFRPHAHSGPVLPDQYGKTYTKSSLLEISVVSIPSCATCVITSKGVTKCAACAEGNRDIGLEEIGEIRLEEIEVPEYMGKAIAGCPRGRKCPTSEMSHPDLCIVTNCPMKAGMTGQGHGGSSGSGTMAGEKDVLAGIEFKTDRADVLDLEDEHEHVLISAGAGDVTRAIRRAMAEVIAEQVTDQVRKELNWHAGRLD